MVGKVDNIKPENSDESAVNSRYVTISGRNTGRPLADLFIVKNYTAIKLDDMIQDALSEAGADITYVSASNLPEVDAEFNKTYLQNGFIEACQTTTDPVTSTGYDFTVRNDKTFAIWALANAPHSGVTLKSVAGAADNNILKIDPASTLGEDIRNYVRVDGGPLKDHYTEGSADAWIGSNCTVTDEYGLSIYGGASIKVTATNPIQPHTAYIQFPVYNQDSIDLTTGKTSASLWFYFHDLSAFDDSFIFIYAMDDEGNEIKYRTKVDCSSGNWQEIKFDLGLGTEIKNWDILNNGWVYQTGNHFTWNIKRLGITSTVISTYWIDGLQIGSVNTWAYAQNAASIAAYGKRMIPINRSDIRSQKMLQEIADTELANRCQPAKKLTLTCTYQPNLLYAGYLVNVLAPNDHIGTAPSSPLVYRIISLHHTAEPGVNLCKGHDAITVLELILHEGGVGADSTRFKLASSPQAAINQRTVSRLNVLEKSVSGSGSIVAGKGGGNGLTKDIFGFIDVAGINFGGEWGSLYRQTVGDDKVIELGGTGLIIDGSLNVDRISMNQGELSLGRFGGDGGYIYFHDAKNIIENDARLAQVTIAGQTRPVLAVQAYVGSGGKYGAWDLGTLDVSNLFVDHLMSSSGDGIYLFDSLRFCYSADGVTIHGVHLFDALNSVGSTGQVLTVNAEGLPQWQNVSEVISALVDQPVTTTSSPRFVALHLTGNDHQVFTTAEVLSYLWGFENGRWLPTHIHIPTGENYIRLSDTATNLWTDISLLMVEGYGGAIDPLLAVGTGMIVKKDLAVGGYVASEQGLVAVGSGMQNQFDPPGAWLFHSNYSALHSIESRASAPADPVSGQLYINSGNNHLYMYRSPSWHDMGHVNNYQYSFDTFYIRKNSYGVVLPVWASSAPSTAVSKFYVNTGNQHLYRWNGSTWVDKGVYQPNVPLLIEDLAHLRCADITAGDINPYMDNAYGLGKPDAVWKGVMAYTVYTESFKKLDGTDLDIATEDTDVRFNSVTATNGFKLGTWGETEFNIVQDETQVYLNVNADKDLYLGTNSGYKVIVQRNIDILGNLIYHNTTKVTNLNADMLDGYHSSEFLLKSALASTDLVVNSVKGTNQAGALKAGDVFTVSWDVSYLYLNNMGNLDTYLGTNYGKKVIIQRDLDVLGNLVYHNSTLVSNLNADYLDGYHASAFVQLNSLASMDIVANSVKGTYSGAALKAGDYLTVSWDATYSKITAHGRDLQINLDSGKKLYVVGTINATAYEGLPAQFITSVNSTYFTVSSGQLNLNTSAVLPVSMIPNLSLSKITSGWDTADIVVNSVKGTYSGAALKAGDAFTVSWDATDKKVNLTAHNAHDMYLNVDSGKKVVVGTIRATTYENLPPVTWNGGTVTTGITISMASPNLHLINVGVVDWRLRVNDDTSLTLTSWADTVTALKLTPSGNLTIKGDLCTYGGTALNLPQDTKVAHTGTVYFNVNSTNSGSAVINLQSGGSTKGAFGWDGTKTYLTAFTNGVEYSQMHILGSKIVIHNDTDFYGLLNITSSNPVLNLQYNGANRLDLGFDGSNSYIRARNAGNFDIINENGSITITSSTGVLYTVGGLQIRPNTGNTGQIGNSTQYYYASYTNTVYGKSGDTFDEYDDLALVKQWGEKSPIIPTEYDAPKKPEGDDPFSMLRGEGGNKANGFFDVMAVNSFALGCAKALAKKHDEVSDILLAFYDGIDTHDAKILELENKIRELETKLSLLEVEKDQVFTKATS
jgi:hypothetical protein